ncbi:MAG: hypothetical protein M1482_15725, partial [Chloroflexi bacterium]|nr:hypothetical protein [Chloroflexota bacterium]
STAIGLALLVVSSAFAAAPTDGEPSDALMVPTESLEIAPNTNTWFYFDYSVDYSTNSSSTTSTTQSGPGGGMGRGASQPSATTGEAVDVAVDAGGDKDVQFAIYTPGQASTWLNDPTVTPVGRGTVYRDTLTGLVIDDLHWSGAFNAPGRYYVVVSNLGSEPASIRLSVSGEYVTLYPLATVTPTPTLEVPVTVTPAPTADVEGKIIFETETGGDIYTVNGEGTGLTLVTHGIDPSWLPDGKQITFARWDNGSAGLYVADADGSNEKLVFSAPRVRWPRYSPDGKYIVFSQDKSKLDSDTLWKLGLIDAATGKLTEPQCSQICYSPSWGDDSTTIFYDDPDAGLMKTSILGGSATVVLGPTGTYYDTSAGIIRPIL